MFIRLGIMALSLDATRPPNTPPSSRTVMNAAVTVLNEPLRPRLRVASR
jgi:hypothetical protein